MAMQVARKLRNPRDPPGKALLKRKANFTLTFTRVRLAFDEQ